MSNFKKKMSDQELSNRSNSPKKTFLTKANLDAAKAAEATEQKKDDSPSPKGELRNKEASDDDEAKDKSQIVKR